MGGRFRLTPIYDVMSAQPNTDAGQIRRNKMKLAMAVGKNRHYPINSIVPRHFIETAELAGIPAQTATAWLREIAAKVPAALKKTRKDLLKITPRAMANSISDGVMHRVKQIK